MNVVNGLNISSTMRPLVEFFFLFFFLFSFLSFFFFFFFYFLFYFFFFFSSSSSSPASLNLFSDLRSDRSDPKKILRKKVRQYLLQTETSVSMVHQKGRNTVGQKKASKFLTRSPSFINS